MKELQHLNQSVCQVERKNNKLFFQYVEMILLRYCAKNGKGLGAFRD